MSLASVCRVCLSNNMRMKNIANTQLQTLYEKLTNNQLITDEGRPDSVCYICHLLLLRCCKFVELSKKSEEFLTQLLHNGFELMQETLTSKPVQKNPPHNLTVASISVVSTLTNHFKDDENESKVIIKIEPITKFVVIDTENASVFHDEKDCMEEDIPEQALDSSEPATSSITKPRKGIKCKKPTVEALDQQNVKTTRKYLEIKAEISTIHNKKSRNDLREYKTNTPVKLGTYGCEKCPKTFRQKAYLKRHIRVHTGERPYVCDTCGETFIDSGILKQHIRTHTGEAPYVCHICSKTFKQKPHLKEHVRIHTGEKPHACHQCASTFAHRGSLIRHVRTHTGEKPYHCLKCPRQFSQASNLRKHIRICKVEKLSYQCQKCSRQFSHASNLQNHIRICQFENNVCAKCSHRD